MPTQVSLLDGALASAGTLAIQTNGTTSAITISSAQVATFVNNPIMTGLTASRAVFTDGSKGLTSNAITGTGNVVMSASPTLTGTIDGAALTLSSSLTLSGGTANGVLYLNGSKVATSGSALTFDGNTLNITRPNTEGLVLELDSASASTRTLEISSFTNSVAGAGWRFNASSSAGVLAFSTNSTEGMRLTSTGLGIGTSSPTASANYKSLTISGTSGAEIYLNAGATNYGYMYVDSGGFRIINPQSGSSSGTLQFYTSNTERARIDSSGNLLVGTTSADIIGAQTDGATFRYQTSGLLSVNKSGGVAINVGRSTSTGTLVNFYYNAAVKGTISTDGSTTAYNTSSDYRLKENIQPMTGALAKVQALKPCTYNWKADGSEGEGFIAHELAEIVPQCVTGEKDAVDADGNPVYQGIDTSFLVATLTAALQEAVAEINSLKARLDAANL